MPIGWDNLSVLRSKAIVSKPSTVFSPSSSERVGRESPEPTSSDKPSATPQTVEAWGESAKRKMEELSRNEALRREIALKVS
jgi:hypothetical protein